MYQYYKVVNESVEPCHMTWNKALLTDEELFDYEQFKQSEDFLGYDEADAVEKQKMPEAEKARLYFRNFGKDVEFKVFDRTDKGRQARFEWKFCIGPNVDVLVNKGNLSKARLLCQTYDIPVGRDETVEDLAAKLVSKFGPNERILTQRQWEDSGLRAREKQEIKLKLQPGETTQRIKNEGYLTAYPMTDVEVEEYYESKTKTTEERIEALEAKVEMQRQQPIAEPELSNIQKYNLKKKELQAKAKAQKDAKAKGKAA